MLISLFVYLFVTLFPCLFVCSFVCLFITHNYHPGKSDERRFPNTSQR